MSYICKKCGAQSPTGIGYAADGQTTFPDPAPGCPNLHAVTPVTLTLTVHEWHAAAFALRDAASSPSSDGPMFGDVSMPDLARRITGMVDRLS